MKRILSATLFMMISTAELDALAIEINVGSRAIEIPFTADFVELTPEMSPYYESMRSYAAPTNIRYLTLISKENADLLLNGADTEVHRFMYLETEKTISSIRITKSQFDELQQVYRSQLNELYETASQAIPDAIEEGNQKIEEALDVDVSVELSMQKVFPIHQDADGVIANSTKMTLDSTIDSQSTGKQVFNQTTTLLYVQERVLFLYVSGNENDLEWTRDTSKRWASEIIDANQVSTAGSDEASPSSTGVLNWNRLATNAIIGGIIGGLIGFVVSRYRKRNTK